MSKEMMTVDGNNACAHISYALSEVAATLSDYTLDPDG